MKKIIFIVIFILIISNPVDAKEFRISLGFNWGNDKNISPIIDLKGQIYDNYFYNIISEIEKEDNTSQFLIGFEPDFINKHMSIGKSEILLGFEGKKFRNNNFIIKNRISEIIFDSDHSFRDEYEIYYLNNELGANYRFFVMELYER